MLSNPAGKIEYNGSTSMKLWLTAIIIIIIATGLFFFRTHQSLNSMTLTSPAFSENSPIPDRYTCTGRDERPELEITGVPAGTQSLALEIQDPDAPNGDFVHWLIWNIDPATTTLTGNTLPAGTLEGVNDAGNTGWISPCPPSGTHHYEFRLSALSAPLSIPAGSDKTRFRHALKGKVLATAILIGTYRKP